MGMYTRRPFLRTSSLFLALILLALAPLGALASGGNPPADHNQYVSLHKYASRTDEPGVYQVRLDISNNQKMNVAPVFITFVLDASPSMYLSHLTDDPIVAVGYDRMPTMSPSTDKVSRWEGAWAGLRAALDIFGNPDDNLAYEHTYVSVVAFDGFNARVFTNDAKQGWYFEKTAGNHLSNVEMPNFATAELKATTGTAARTSSSMIGSGITSAYRAAYPANGNGGFVNISQPGMYNATSTTRGRILESIPRYPLITRDIISDHWGANPTNTTHSTYWWLDTNGTSTRHGMETAYNLMEQTYNESPINGVAPEDFQRFVIFLGDGNDQSGTYSQFANSIGGEFFAAALKAPRTVTMGGKAGLNAEVWTIGMGLTATGADSEYYTAQGEVATYTGSVGSAWRNGLDYENFLAYYATNGTESGAATWNNTANASYTEPHLITMAAALNNPANYGSFPSVTYNTSSTSNLGLRNIFDFYAAHGVDKANTVYEHASGGYPGATGGKSAVEIFREYAQRIVVGRNVKATDVIGQQFEIYTPPGEATYELTGTLKDGSSTERWDPGTVTISGNTISWNIPAIPNDGGTISLSYYVKLEAGADPSLYYNTNQEAYLEYDRKGIPGFNGEDENLDYHVKKYFPMPYISPDNGEKVEAGQGEVSTPGTLPVSTGKTGAEGHQENRDMAGSTGSDWAGGIRDIDPGVTAVKTGRDTSGRDKVYVELKSGATMRFQWQFKNAAGEWEDIFGANASHYTLGKQFTLNQTYQLRCRITNQAGKITYTDVIEAMRTVDTSAGLQSKEEGPAIESETLMDAGEEIAVANTATNGQMLAILAGAAVLALGVAGAISYRRRRS